MAGSTFQPPIHLDPTQDSGQQTAFINQNFQSLAAALETNSLRIVLEGDNTMPSVIATAAAANWGHNTSAKAVPHNLGYIPIVIAALNLGTYSFIPITRMVLPSPNTPGWESNYIAADETNLYLNVDVTTFGANLSAGGASVKYYLIQQSAN